MDNIEAIKWLKQINNKYIHGGDEEFDNKRKEAISYAIEILERPEGEWVTVEHGFPYTDDKSVSLLDIVKCPFCKTVRKGRSYYCSWCGAKMRKNNE